VTRPLNRGDNMRYVYIYNLCLILSSSLYQTYFNASFSVGSRESDLSPDYEDVDGDSVSADYDDDNYGNGNEVDEDRKKSSSASSGPKVTVNPTPLAM